MEIILIRHGKPDVELKGLLAAQDFEQLANDYAASGIADDPPQDLNNRFDSHYVVCSHLNRSRQSAHKLGFTTIHISDELFTETNIPYFKKFIVSLPIPVWVVMLRLLWVMGFSRNGESFNQALKRAKQATNKLILLAKENKKVILVGHGLMNRLIARELRLNNWQGPKSPGKKYWEYGVYNL